MVYKMVYEMVYKMVYKMVYSIYTMVYTMAYTMVYFPADIFIFSVLASSMGCKNDEIFTFSVQVSSCVLDSSKSSVFLRSGSVLFQLRFKKTRVFYQLSPPHVSWLKHWSMLCEENEKMSRTGQVLLQKPLSTSGGNKLLVTLDSH